MLQEDIQAGQTDLAQACSHSLAHGVLLALRYLAPLVPWQTAAPVPDLLASAQEFLTSLLHLLDQATGLALPCLANPQDSNIGKAVTLLYCPAYTLQCCCIRPASLCMGFPVSSARSGHWTGVTMPRTATRQQH